MPKYLDDMRLDRQQIWFFVACSTAVPEYERLIFRVVECSSLNATAKIQAILREN